MKIQPIQQPTFQMKWESKVLHNVTKSKIELDNGKKLLIRDGGWYKLQSLYDEAVARGADNAEELKIAWLESKDKIRAENPYAVESVEDSLQV